MTKEHEKIIKWVTHGVDDRIVMLELAKQTGDKDFYDTINMLVGLFTPADSNTDANSKLYRIMEKGGVLDSKRLTEPDKSALVEEMYAAMLDTVNKLLVVVQNS